MSTEQRLLAAAYHHAGEELIAMAEDVAAVAAQLPDDYAGPCLPVYDAAGFVRGWVRSRTDWRAA